MNTLTQTHRLNRATTLRRNRYLGRLAALALGIAATANAAEIAHFGGGILGVKAAVDTGPGQALYQAGTLLNINDGDLATRVDNWSNGADQGQGVSYVGILWPSLRFEQITSLTLVLAAFGDGGWFGPNGTTPGDGILTLAHLTQPTVQVSTNGGNSWLTINVTSDYLNSLNGAAIGGPNALTAIFILDAPVTNINGLRIIGPNGGNAGTDANGFLGVFELAIDATFTDNDADGMPDAWERANGLNDAVNDAEGDADGDGLRNLAEYEANTEPDLSDTDGDGYSDGAEVAGGSDPRDAASIPGNLARDGTGILGTRNDTLNVDTPYTHSGSGTAINDGNFATRVDTYNGTGTDKQSYVGITWLELQTNPVLRLELTLATFGDGGWFGPNGRSPAPGGALNQTYLTTPSVQVTADAGTTWTNVNAVSDYLTVMNGHRIGGGGVPNPSSVTSTFTLDPPVANIDGVRIVGSEGGTASGGFIGVFELKVYARTDVEPDGMDDEWERRHGLVIGVSDGGGDLDADGLTNLQEYLRATDPQNPDTDGDGLKDGPEVNTYLTNPVSADTDADGLTDSEELNTHQTNPRVADTDGDLFPDGQELQLGTDPLLATSAPANLALRSDASAILGTEDSIGIDTSVFNAGSAANINDGDPTTRVDTWNDTSPDTLSFVGITWTNPLTTPIATLELKLATFFDGGWFGVNNAGPGSGGVLSAAAHLVEPQVQVSLDGNNWVSAAFTSDYLTALEGHPLPAIDFGPPTLATARFRFTTPQTGIRGVRLLGSEGGTASGGFLGVFDLAALTRVPQPVTLLNPTLAAGQLRFEINTEAGGTYVVLYKDALTNATWQTLTTVIGDGTRKPVADPIGPGARFYRIESQ